ncbi:PRC-barrel domain-containing protein [Halotia wernerae UHCC 0503]|nr:PRC-barrel domain-containing protein [Halotia wernerae UHCC 0503]
MAVLEQNKSPVVRIGRVSRFWLDITNHRVAAIACKSGFLGRNVQFFGWQRIEAIGKDSILLSLPTESLTVKPDSTELVVGHELWTDAGNKAGNITDYCLDPQTGAVVAYLFRSNGWQGITDGTYILLPQAVISLGAKRLIAQAEQVQNAEQFSVGLSEKMAKAAEFIKEDYAQTRRNVVTVMEGSVAIAA